MLNLFTRQARIVFGLVLIALLATTNVASAATIWDDANTDWSYSGTWSADTGVVGAINGTQHLSNTANSSANIGCLTENGNISFTYYFTKAYNRGKAKVTVTDPSAGIPIYEATIDMYASGTLRQQTFTYSAPYSANGYGVLITVLGQKNASSTNTYVDIDALSCKRA